MLTIRTSIVRNHGHRGWQARIRWGRWTGGGLATYDSRFYGDREWGGSRKALHRAERWIATRIREKRAHLERRRERDRARRRRARKRPSKQRRLP